VSENYIKVLWTCGMGDACTNTTRPGTHEEYIAASVCCGGLQEVDQSCSRFNHDTMNPGKNDPHSQVA